MKSSHSTDEDLIAQLEALRRENIVLRSALTRGPQSVDVDQRLGTPRPPLRTESGKLVNEVVKVDTEADRAMFEELVLQLADVLNTRHALVALLNDPDCRKVRTLAVVSNGELVDNIEYDLEHTPCRDVVDSDACFHPSSAQSVFPRDALLTEMEVESYVGAPLRASDGTTLGLIAALHHEPLDERLRPVAVIQVFADRAAALLERIRSESRLRESEERLRLALDASNQATWDLDLVTGIGRLSEGTGSLLGLEADEFGESLEGFRRRVHPDDLPLIDGGVKACREGLRADFHAEFRIRDVGDAWRWLESWALVQPDAAGRPVRLLGTVMDVTGRRERARELLLNRFAVESAGEAMLRIDPEGRILEVNAAACQRLKYTRESLLAMRAADLEPGLGAAGWQKRWTRVRRSRHLLMETVLRTRTGDSLPVEMSISYFEFEGEEFCSAFVRDISERKRLEEQLLHSQKLEGIGRLAGGIAHDFNNLLTVVLGNLELVEDELPDDTRAADCIRTAIRASMNAAQLTSRLLAFARKQVGVPRILNVTRSLEQLVEVLQRMVGERIRVVTELEEDLPAVRFDEGQLQQVLINLTVNASDAMPDGGTLTIRTRRVRVRDSEFARIEVHDTGHGIAPEAMPHLFEPFFTTKEPGQGTGLGLAMCHGIVAAHGGRIWADSVPGKGTSFLIELPATREAQPENEAESADEGVPKGTETVLLVEDDEQVRQMAERSLRSLGYEVLCAADGEQALSVSARHSGRIHLLLADVVLPSTSGKEVSRRLRQARPGLKVLFASGYAEQVLTGEETGGRNRPFLPKPFTPSSLGRKVREVLDS